MKLLDFKFESRIKQLDARIIIKKPLFVVRGLFQYGARLFSNKDSLRGVSFATSYFCNFNCTHCYASRFRETNERPLALEEKAVVIKECLSLGAISFDFVGGEIGLSAELDKLVKFCQPHKTYIMLASNGWDMGLEKIRHLKNIGLDKISISIDSGKEEEHDKFRRKSGSYKKCFEALENIRKEGLKPSIITCVCRGDTKKKSFLDLVDYAVKNRIDLVFSAIIPFGRLENNMNILCDEEDLAYMKHMHEKYVFLTRDSYENMGKTGCPAGKQVIYVSEYGDVMPCAFLHIAFGNVRYESIKDIRERILKVPEFKNYHQRCLASEERSFMEKYSTATLGSKQYPPSAKDVFLENKEINAPSVFVKNILKKERFCPLCGLNNKEIIAWGREHEFENTTHDLFFVVKCLDCGMVYLNPTPDDSTLNIIYPDNYYCYKEQDAALSSKKSLLSSLKNILNNYIGFPSQIKKIIKSSHENNEEPLRVLDIGCGTGAALDVFKQVSAGQVEGTGLDISGKALEIVAKKGFKTIHSSIEKAFLLKKYFDIVYSSNVIEHISDPAGMIKKAAQSLKPNGIFLCETPNFGSLDARLFYKSGHWGGFHFPRHWNFFTLNTFRKIAEKNGFTVESVSYFPVPIFWIWTLHSYFYRGKGKKNIADSFFPLFENKSNFLKSLGLKSFFTFLDLFIKFLTGQTSLMSIVLKKQE